MRIKMNYTFRIHKCNSFPTDPKLSLLAHDPIIITMGEQTTTTETTLIVMAALSTLSPSQLSSLSHSLSSTFLYHRRRLVSLLSSPALFSHALDHLYSLPLPQKSLLIARHLLSFLDLLARFLHPRPGSSTTSHRVRLRDLDSVLLLLFFCEVRQNNPTVLETSPTNWQRILANICSDTMLKLTRFPLMSPVEVLGTFVEKVVKFKRFVGTKGCDGGEEGREVAAAAAAVVALPSVEVENGGECVICKEEMREGRDVCQLPCQHMFHWMCVLPWLRKRNTCPCCRFRLPTDDVYGEIRRLWEVIAKAGAQHLGGDQCT